MPKRVLSMLSAVVLGLAAAAQAETTFDNPLITQRADGQVYRHTDGYYYFMGTVPEYDRLELRRSKTLQGLGDTKELSTIWKKHATGQMGSHIWAPEIHHIDGKWYVYFAAGESRNVWTISVFALENDGPNPLEGTWTEKGQVKLNWNTFALDFTTFDLKGTRYALWAEKDPAAPSSNSSLFIAKMDTPTSIVGKGVKISMPEFPWEIVKYKVNEGPAALIKNGRVFVTYSASATDFNYCMGMLTAKDDADLLDPKSWAKAKEPVLKTDEAAGVFGPGHNGFTTVDDGKGGLEDVILYHDCSYKNIKGDPLNDVNRCERAQVIHWNADGTPNFMPPVPDAPGKKFPAVAP